MKAKCYDKADQSGIESETWVGQDEEPNCVLSPARKSSHALRVNNHKPNLVAVNIVRASSRQDLLLFTKNGHVDTWWSNRVEVPRRWGSSPRSRETRAAVEPNPAKSGNNELIDIELTGSTYVGFGRWTSPRPFPRRLVIEVDIT